MAEYLYSVEVNPAVIPDGATGEAGTLLEMTEDVWKEVDDVVVALGATGEVGTLLEMTEDVWKELDDVVVALYAETPGGGVGPYQLS